MTRGADEAAARDGAGPGRPGGGLAAFGSTAGTERRLLAYEPSVRPMLALSVASGLVGAVLAVLAAVVMAAIVARVFLEGAALPEVAPGLVALALLAAGRGLLVALGERSAQLGGSRLAGRLRADLTGRLAELGPSAVGRERSGELVAVATQGLEAIETDIVVYQPARVLAVAVPVLVLGVVLVLDPPTVLVLLFTGPILVLLLGFIGGRAKVLTDRRFDELRWMSALFLDLLQGLATLKAFGRSVEQVETIRTVSRRFGDTTMEVLRTAFQTALVLEWGAAVAMAVVAVEVSLRLMSGSIAFERALAVLIVTPEFFLPLRTLAIRYHAGAAGRTAAERIFTVLGGPPSVAPAPVAAPAPPAASAPTGASEPSTAPAPTAAPAIRLSGVRFGYPDRAPALDGVSFDLPAGGLTVLAGATGAGKSTLVGLLLGFLDADDGAILVDGRPLDAIDPAGWRAALGWVPQRPHLFHGSVAENLRLGRPDATPDELRRAAEAADADGFIRALPGGYDAPVGEDGLRLSGGERQRIAIARALLRDAPLLILDEPTSHLDERSEAAVLGALRRLSGRATVVVVSHRLRVARAAERVVVLDRGRVVAEGSPTELLADGGPLGVLAAADAVSPEDPS